MIVALIDNGSVFAAAYRHLRAVAAALSQRTGTKVHAVSWKHSDRIPADELGGAGAWVVADFVRQMVALGQREYLFVPFFVSAQGAIGSALRDDLQALQAELDRFEFTFTEGLAERGVIPIIAADRIRSTITTHALARPRVIVVDHGGPSAESARLRDELAAEIRSRLGDEVGPFAAASMEGEHPPLLAAQLGHEDFVRGSLVVAPLLLSPGRHAGPEGDIARICRAAETDCHITELVGTHPLAVDALAEALREHVSPLHAQPFA